jgi:hypothetical protein
MLLAMDTSIAMPRRPRPNPTSLPRHIIQRGNNRSARFFAEDNCAPNHGTNREAVKSTNELAVGRVMALNSAGTT